MLSATAPTPDHLEDLDSEELVARAQNGDRTALRAALQRHRAGLVSFARSKFRLDSEEAEDVVQDALMRAYRHLYRFDETRAKWSTWLFTITKNLCKNQLRNMDRARDSTTMTDLEEWSRDDEAPEIESGPLFADETYAPDRLYHESRVEGVFREALEELSEVRAEALRLRALKGLTYEEISHRTGVPIGTVKSRLSRARKCVREFLRREAPEAVERVFDTPASEAA